MANKFINELNTIESVAVADELPIWDSSESDTRKTTVNKLSSAITVNLVGEGISAPPSSNAVANAIKNTDAVLYVETLPTNPNIKNVIYHNTTDGKYYVGNKINQTTSELNTDSVRYVQTLPVSPNIENFIYAITAPSGKYKFYAGDKENQTTQELGGSGAIFTGTQAEWDALTTAEKNEYSQANITDTSSTVFIPVDTVADGNMNPVTSNAVYDALKDRLNGMNMTITTSNGTNFSTRIRLKAPNYVSIYIFGDQGIYIINVGANTSILHVNTLLGSNPPVSPTLTSNSDGSYQLEYTYGDGVYSRQLIIS